MIVPPTDIKLERHLEGRLENSPRALTLEPILWIGKQLSARTEEGTVFPDLLGVDAEGNLILVEFKRDQAPREVIAQLLEYATWANELIEQQIHEIGESYFENRDGFKESTFQDTFRYTLEIPENDELPLLNQSLRLFIVAEKIPERVVNVCEFLRASHGMNISCIKVTAYQTVSNETIISMEVIVGNELVIYPRHPSTSSSQPSWQLDGKTGKEVVWEAAQKLTNEDYNVDFTLSQLYDSISEKYSDFKPHVMRRLIGEDRVNDPTPNDNSIVNSNGKYWWVDKGKYRLYDPVSDVGTGNADIIQVDHTTQKDSA